MQSWECTHFTCIFPFDTALCYYSTTSQRQILIFLHQYICLTALVTSTFQVIFLTFLSSENHESQDLLISNVSHKPKHEMFLYVLKMFFLFFALRLKPGHFSDFSQMHCSQRTATLHSNDNLTDYDALL